MMVSFYAVFFPRGVLDGILNLIESVSEGFPSYSSRARIGEVCLEARRKDARLCMMFKIDRELVEQRGGGMHQLDLAVELPSPCSGELSS